MSPIAKRLFRNWEMSNYTGTVSSTLNTADNTLALAAASPKYTMRTIFNYTNRSLLMNARREMVVKKNARKFNGNSGLRLVKASGGLKSYTM